MYKVRKLFRVPVGHRLSKHKSLCKYFHGHNLKIEVGIKSETLNENDMVIDFGDLKPIVEKLIIRKLDHGMVMNINDPQLESIRGTGCTKLTVLSCDPTAESLCKYIFESIDGYIEGYFKSENKIKMDFVRIWENDNSMAEYIEG